MEFKLSSHAKIGLPPEPTSRSLRHPLQPCTTISYKSIWIHTSVCDGTASERIGVSFQIYHICWKGFQLGQQRTFREFRVQALEMKFEAVQYEMKSCIKQWVKWINMARKDEDVEFKDQTSRVQGCYMNYHNVQCIERWCSRRINGSVQCWDLFRSKKRKKGKTNWSNRIETIDRHDLSTTNYTSTSKLQELCQGYQGISRPSHRLQVEEVARQPTPTLVCRLHGPWDMFMGWCCFSACASSLPQTSSHQIMWSRVYICEVSEFFVVLVSSSLKGYLDIARFTGQQVLFPNFSFNPSITVSASKLTWTSWSKNIAE